MCPQLSIGCVVQNGTHSGTVFPSATPCSCCETCLEHLRTTNRLKYELVLIDVICLDKGDYCSIGKPGSPVPNSYCGPGLKCLLGVGEEHPRCYPRISYQIFYYL